MIVTRSWLDEFVDISAYGDEEIANTLNSVGIEVAAVTPMNIPQNIVVGKVLGVEKHPNAEKLRVCSIDTGIGVSTIVCGAANVAEGQLVPVAMIGAQLPNGIEIKPADLRGVQSYGMICSSSEIGLPKLADGIMVLDASIPKLKIGRQLCEYGQLNDTVFELELTPNRGDCLSVYGIARELAAYYGLKLRELEFRKEGENDRGIGRIMNLHYNNKASANVLFSLFERNSMQGNCAILVDLRMAFAQISSGGGLFDKLISYATHATGVIMYAFGESAFTKSNEDKIEVSIDKNSDGFDVTVGNGELVKMGASQSESSKPTLEDHLVILQACYVDPASLQGLNAKLEKKDDDKFYKAVRGSEPDLAFGIGYLATLFQEYFSASFFAGTIEDIKPLEKVTIKVDISKINTIIGSSYDKNHIVTILRRLAFDVTVNAEFDSCIVKAPNFRHDIENIYDLAEEIVRMKGIDTIEAKPLDILEAKRTGEAYDRYVFFKQLRNASVSQGFFETVHFIFSERKIYERFALPTIAEKQELINPITAELDTLRTTLLVNILQSASKNIKNSVSCVALFEQGTVFDKKRGESQKIAFVWSGDGSKASLQNAGKPQKIQFQEFAMRIANIVGKFELQKVEGKGEFFHPYQAANMVQNGQTIGFISKLHPKAQEFFELPDTMICEIELKNLSKPVKKAAQFSKLQPISRDLTLQVPKTLPFSQIRAAVNDSGIAELKAFYAVDIYNDKHKPDDISLTVRMELQPQEKTLDENEIAAIVEKVLYALKSEFEIGIKS